MPFIFVYPLVHLHLFWSGHMRKKNNSYDTTYVHYSAIQHKTCIIMGKWFVLSWHEAYVRVRIYNECCVWYDTRFLILPLLTQNDEFLIDEHQARYLILKYFFLHFLCAILHSNWLLCNLCFCVGGCICVHVYVCGIFIRFYAKNTIFNLSFNFYSYRVSQVFLLCSI